MSTNGVVTLSDDARSYAIGREQSEFVIGRDPAADLVIADPRCSRRHARLVRVDDAMMLEPLSERSRTLLNGRVVMGRVVLSHGDVIGVGGAELRVEADVHTRKITRVLDEEPSPSPAAGGVRLPSGDGEVVIGRDRSDADAVVDHPSISRRHARLARRGGATTIEDLGSTNGVVVNGHRVSGVASLKLGDSVALGPLAFVVDAAGLAATRAGDAIGVDGHDIVLEITADGNRRRLLDGVSLSIEPGRFVAVLGPSGCGKSTLIRVLSGRARMTSGHVTMGDLDLEANFETIKHTLAFVPQRETLPEELTINEALRYTARLRLSADSTASEIDAAVAKGLARVGMTEHASKPIAKLSGGQRKRAALANELIARPAIIYADEVTSGLDDSTDREIMRLFQELAHNGVTIICVTHSVSNIADCCDDVIVMAPGGKLAYHGSPRGALSHFHVESLAAVYERVGDVPSRPSVATAPRAEAVGVRARPAVRTDRRAPFAQLPALTARTLRVTLANRRGLLFIAAQSVVVGVLFRIVFGGAALPEAMQPSFVFLLGIASFWFGCSNASKEIVKERALFRLERDINLRIPSYVLAKLLVQAAVGFLQVASLFATMLIAGVDIPRVGPLVVANLVIAVVGVSLGLAVSAFSRKEEQAASLVPIALIPQLLLSTALVPQLSDFARGLAKSVVSAYWMYQVLLDTLAGGGATVGEPAVIFVAHGLLFVVLACVILYVDQSGA